MQISTPHFFSHWPVDDRNNKWTYVGAFSSEGTVSTGRAGVLWPATNSPQETGKSTVSV